MDLLRCVSFLVKVGSFDIMMNTKISYYIISMHVMQDSIVT